MSIASTLSGLCILAAALSATGQLRFEGRVPPEVNSLSLASEYTRIYRIIAPQQRPDRSVLSIVYYSKSDATGKSVTLPEWGGGGTIGPNLIVIPVDFKPFLQQNFSQITVHELVHAALYRAYPGVALPRWFHEGLAMMLSGELSFEENTVISKAIFFSRLMPLSSIDSVNYFGRGRADLAYSQSHIALLMLVEQYGMDVIPDCLIATRKNRNFGQGLRDAVGLTPQEFEESVRKYIASKYRFLFFFTDSLAWWVGIAILFIIGFIVTMRRNKKRLAAMEEKERQEQETAAAAAKRIDPSEASADTKPDSVS
jgi:hypothetical protein